MTSPDCAEQTSDMVSLLSCSELLESTRLEQVCAT